MTFHGIDNMKKIIYIICLALLSAAFMTACDTIGGQPEDGVAGKTTKEFLVFVDPYTRASLDDDYSIEWNLGDRIAMSDGSQCYTVEAVETGLPARFVGELPAADKYHAVYPFKETIECDENGVLVEIPAVQAVSASCPSPETDCWVGESRGAILQMRNVCGHILMSIEADDITAITIEGISNEVMAGKMSAKVTADGLTLTPADEAEYSVRIVPASGDAFVSGTYCLSLAPVKFKHGLLLSFDRLDGGRSYRTYADSLDVASSSIVSIGNWDLTAPELGTVTTGSVTLTRSTVLLTGSMTVTNFVADRITCGFEYRTVSETEWSSVTCPQASVEFSYELLLESAEPYVFRAWAKMNDSEKVIYGEESEEVTAETLEFHLVFDENRYETGYNFLWDTWKWGTNSNSENENLNGTTYNYIYNGVDYPFTFWSYRPEPTSGGYALWVTSGTQKVYGLSLSYAKDLAPSQPAWMQMPGPVGLKLIEINATLYAAFKGTISPSVNENDGTASGDPVATFTGKSSVPLSLKGTKAGTRYYFCTTDNQRPTLKNITLTYLYTE